MTILKPQKLSPGDIIGIVAPSLPVLPSFRENYESGKKTLSNLGFNILEGKTIKLKRWWAAGTPKEQAEDINLMFSNKTVKAIMAQAGGHSAISVLEHLDYDLIRQNPKPFIGMSDITVYHLAFLAKTGLIGFHMDDVTFGLGWNYKEAEMWQAKFGIDSFKKILTQVSPLGVVKPLTEWETWRGGNADGRLIGGNLHLMSLQLGTPYFPPLSMFEGAILFWEDVGQYLYDIARSLYQLKYAGILERIAGMLVGKITATQTFSDKNVTEPSLKEMVLEIACQYNFPILAEVDFGHNTVNIPMPLGVKASFDSSNRKLKFLESPVA